jgi:hypothetical protein
METRADRLRIAALVISITLGGLTVFALASLGLPEESKILSFAIIMVPISLFVAAGVALFYPRVTGWALIVAGIISGTLMCSNYPEEFAGSLIWALPQIIVGVLWLCSSASRLRALKQLGQVSKKQVLMQTGLILAIILVIGASFVPHTSARRFQGFGEGAAPDKCQNWEVGQWSVWEIVRGLDLSETPQETPILHILAYSCVLGIFLVLVGLPGMLSRRLRKLVVLIIVGSIVVILSTGINGLLLESGTVETGYEKVTSGYYEWEPEPNPPYDSGRIVPGSFWIINKVVYSAKVGLWLVLLGAITLLVLMTRRNRNIMRQIRPSAK